MTETMPAAEPELRSAFIAPLTNVELRQAGNGEDFTLTGHAAVFDRWSEDLWTFAGSFRERIAPGAFTDVLDRDPDVRLLYNHDGLTLARTKSKTLELSEDEDGLRVWARLAPTGIANDLRLAMQRGDIDQMSFAFTIGEDEWHEDHDTEEVERTILRVADLFDVSVVSFPAYPDTSAVIRELRRAADQGLITLPDPTNNDDEASADVAQPETDAAGTPESRDPDVADGDTSTAAPAETDPADEGVDALAELRRLSRETANREREAFLRLSKEVARL